LRQSQQPGPATISNRSFIVIGGTGLIGSAVVSHLRELGADVLALDSKNYAEAVGRTANVLVNCNGNTFRFRANQDPTWDFQASVTSVERSLFDFRVDLYIYVSTIDVYDVLDDPARNREDAPIDLGAIDIYGFHKWTAERIVDKFARRAVIFRCGTAIGPGLKKGPLFDVLNSRPLFMSPESTLSLIDTRTVAEAVRAIVEEWPSHEIINLTGTGTAKMAELAGAVDLPVQVALGAELKVHRYHINNSRLQTLIPVPTSLEAGQRFIARALETRGPAGQVLVVAD
jgi:nucleoside-diphosphate-sugar epimerase